MAADALFFCRGELDVAAREALSEASAIAYALSASQRWPQELSDQLLDDLRACGPPDGGGHGRAAGPAQVVKALLGGHV